MIRLQYKLAAATFLFGGLSLFVVASIYFLHGRDVDLETRQMVLVEEASRLADQLDTLLRGQADVAATLSMAPLVLDAVQKSNARFDSLAPALRDERIAELNRRWMETADRADPFVRPYLFNPLAAYLAAHEMRFPGDYGEIFVTDRHGVLVAATEKLTTLNHAHKHWWRQAYDNGRGRIFFDDRGFDTSSVGYVLGVVVPVRKGTEVVGILKANFNLTGPLMGSVRRYNLGGRGEMRVVRESGEVVIEAGSRPLSTSLPDALTDRLAEGDKGASIGSGRLNAYAPVPISVGRVPGYGFGGVGQAVGHVQGNPTGGWYVVVSQPIPQALAPLQKRVRQIALIGVLLIAAMAIAAIWLGRRAVAPVVRMADAARRVGAGDFATRIPISSRDELGQLASAFNKMVADLASTTISRDRLAEEVDTRRRAEALLRTFLDGIDAPAFFATADGTVLEANQALAKRVGKPKEAIVGRRFSEAAPGFVDEMRQRHVQQVIETGVPVQFEDSRGGLDLNNSIYPVCDRDGKVTHLAVLSFDITSRKQVESELRVLTAGLEASNRELEQFAYIASHDLQEPLRKILTFGELLEEHAGKRLDEEAAGYLERMRDAAARMRRLIDDLLQYSRVASKAQRLERVELNTLVERVLSDLDHRIEEVEARIQVEPLPAVAGDEVQIEQVFLNLLSNALKYHKPDVPPVVQVTGRTLGPDTVEIAIADNGIGFDEKYAGRIFEPFQRLHTRTEYEGTGIGLAICRKVVDQHGGTLRARSRPGEGATFIFTLPKASEQVHEQTATGNHPAGRG